VPDGAEGALDGMLSVLHVLAPAPAGGLERVVRALARAQVARGYAVTVAAVVTPPATELTGARKTGPQDATLASLGCEGATVVPVPVSGRGYWEERRQVAAIARRYGVRVAHTHGYRPDVVDAGGLRGAGLPVVSTVHGFTGGNWRNRVYQRLQLWSFRRFDAVVAVSEPMLNGLVASGVPRARMHLIPNAYAATGPILSRDAARERLGLPADAYVVGWVGRLSHEKGLDVLLDALAILRDRPIVLAVVGEGGERARLQARASVLRIGSAIRWAGLVPEAAPLYRAFDVFALSSRTEGTPIALFEAMDALVPVVATAVGGVPAVVSSAEALLVPPDQPAQLADALHTVLSDPAAARTRASAARQRLVSTYGVEAWAARYDDVYREVLNRRHQGSGVRGRGTTERPRPELTDTARGRGDVVA
jgi:glycosyltransferase involved in cell wall biosynthesis